MQRERKGWPGNPPPAEEGWSEIAEWVDPADGTAWRFFVKDARVDKATSPWRTCKIVARGRVLDKANFWVNVNPAAQKIAIGSAMLTMQEHRPNMCGWVRKVLAGLGPSPADDIL